jgi:hypothetical protein
MSAVTRTRSRYTHNAGSGTAGAAGAAVSASRARRSAWRSAVSATCSRKRLMARRRFRTVPGPGHRVLPRAEPRSSAACRPLHGRCRPYHRASAIAWVGAAGDVPERCERFDDPSGAPSGSRSGSKSAIEIPTTLSAMSGRASATSSCQSSPKDCGSAANARSSSPVPAPRSRAARRSGRNRSRC